MYHVILAHSCRHNIQHFTFLSSFRFQQAPDYTHNNWLVLNYVVMIFSISIPIGQCLLAVGRLPGFKI
jgi:hypothetical protein